MKEYIYLYVHCNWKVLKKALTATTFWHLHVMDVVHINFRDKKRAIQLSGTKRFSFILTCLMGKGSGKLSAIQRITGANYIRLAQGKQNLKTTGTIYMYLSKGHVWIHWIYLNKWKVTRIITRRVMAGNNLPGIYSRWVKGSHHISITCWGAVVTIEDNYVFCKWKNLHRLPVHKPQKAHSGICFQIAFTVFVSSIRIFQIAFLWGNWTPALQTEIHIMYEILIHVFKGGPKTLFPGPWTPQRTRSMDYFTDRSTDRFYGPPRK